jgi:hypothetical protein
VTLIPSAHPGWLLINGYILGLIARDPRHPGMATGMAWLNFEMLAMFLFIEARSIAVAGGRAAGLGAAFLPITLAAIVATSLLLKRGRAVKRSCGSG